jgi:hypothetical protein
MEVLECRRASIACAQGVLVVGDGHALGGREDVLIGLSDLVGLAAVS